MKVYTLWATFDINPDGDVSSFGGIEFTKSEAFSLAKRSLRSHAEPRYTYRSEYAVDIRVEDVPLKAHDVKNAMLRMSDGAGLWGEPVSRFQALACGSCETCREGEDGDCGVCENPIIKKLPHPEAD